MFELTSSAGAARQVARGGRVVGSYVQPLLDTAAASNVSAADLERGAGLPPGALQRLPESLAADTYLRLLDVGADLCGDACFGLHVGEHVKLGTYSVYGLILLSCRDFGQAFEQTLRYESLAHDLGRSHLRIEGGVARYAWHSHYRHASHHLADSVFAGIRVFGNWLAGCTLPAPQVAFCHAAPSDAKKNRNAEYVRIFGALPRFDAPEHVASFDAQLLARPVPNADVSLYPVLQQHAEQLLRSRLQDQSLGRSEDHTGIVARVHAVIIKNLAHDRVRLATVAEELHLTPRTPQRKLSDAHVNFQLVLDQARCALAKDYLRQAGLGLTDIAFLLGYQEQSAFTHAFKEWTGLNPGAWRANLG
ncbi:MAG: AraC-like DNA-binding protein [Janthinobacterium sp.]|jgi:AraC-like DNA-binding protein